MEALTVAACQTATTGHCSECITIRPNFYVPKRWIRYWPQYSEYYWPEQQCTRWQACLCIRWEMWLQLFLGLISVKRSGQSVCLCTYGYVQQRFQGPFTCLLLQEDLNSCVAMWLPLLHLEQKYLILPTCTCSNLRGVMRSREVWLQLKIMAVFPSLMLSAVSSDISQGSMLGSLHM